MHTEKVINHEHDGHAVEIIRTDYDNPVEKTVVAVCHDCPPTEAEANYGMLRTFNLTSTTIINDEDEEEDW